jgi:hypothetical protein
MLTMVPVTVCADPEVAEVLVARGAAVVFYGADAGWVARALAAPRPPGARVAVLIGDPADPAVEAAAQALAAEQFGGDPVVVRTLSHARQLEPGSGTVDAHPDQ